MDGLRTVGINDLNYQDSLVKLIRSSEALQKRFGWDKAFADTVAGSAARVPGREAFRRLRRSAGHRSRVSSTGTTSLSKTTPWSRRSSSRTRS